MELQLAKSKVVILTRNLSDWKMLRLSMITRLFWELSALKLQKELLPKTLLKIKLQTMRSQVWVLSIFLRLPSKQTLFQGKVATLQGDTVEDIVTKIQNLLFSTISRKILIQANNTMTLNCQWSNREKTKIVSRICCMWWRSENVKLEEIIRRKGWVAPSTKNLPGTKGTLLTWENWNSPTRT